MEQRPGWWLASDGNWYPPESHPNYTPPPPPPPPPTRTSPGARESSGVRHEGARGSNEISAWRRIRQEFSVARLAMIATCIVYVLVPTDALPEAILGPFGFTDDVLAALAAVGLYVRGRRKARLRS